MKIKSKKNIKQKSKIFTRKIMKAGSFNSLKGFINCKNTGNNIKSVL